MVERGFNMVLQERDIEIVKFIDLNPCYGTTLQALFFSNSVSSCNKRLLKLVKENYIKRFREYPNQPYFYYRGNHSLKQLTHYDLQARVYLYFKLQGFNIVEFEREPLNLKGLRPDVRIIIEKDGKQKLIYAECEFFNNCLKKKIELYKKNYKNDFSVMYCCNDKCNIDTLGIKVNQIPLSTLQDLGVADRH